MSAEIVGQQASSPERLLTKDGKRKRIPLSCNDCRRRKLKCDRELPCSRCKRGGIASSCTYDYNVRDGTEERGVYESAEEDGAARPKARRTVDFLSSETLNAGGPNPQGGSSGLPSLLTQADAIKRLERRLARLEAGIPQPASGMARPGYGSGTDKYYSTSNEKFYSPEMMLFKGRGFATQFYGPSTPISSLGTFGEVRKFMESVYPGSTLERLHHECNVIEARTKQNNAHNPDLSSKNLVELVPSHATADHLTQLYFDTFETTYRILHSSTFWSDYSAFWDNPQDAKPQFAAVLLMLMATVICTSTKEPVTYVPGGSKLRAQAIVWIRACDTWIEQQSNKHRLLEVYQVRCLRVLAASTSCLKTKEIYVNVEALLNMSKSAGLHRDPRMLDAKCSVFEAEIRRRLWATTMELELQASIDRGTPSSLSAIPSDCWSPLNINDGEFGPASQQMPQSRPTFEYTTTSYLHISAQSRPLRIKLCSLVNDPDSTIEWEDVLNYEEEIMEALDTIPKWTNLERMQTLALLDLQLRQFLILLYFQYAQRTGSDSKTRYSRMVCFDTATILLDIHTKLIDSGNFALCLNRMDHFRAALCICQVTFRSSFLPNGFWPRSLSSVFSALLDQAFRVLEERAMRPGRGMHLFWFISAACSLVQSTLTPEHAVTFKQQATDRVSQLYYKLLALQEDTSRVNLANGSKYDNSGTLPGPSSLQPFEAMNQQSGLELDTFDFGDPSEWTLSDIWSFNLNNAII